MRTHEKCTSFKAALFTGGLLENSREALELLMKLPVSSPKRTACDHLTLEVMLTCKLIGSGIHKQWSTQMNRAVLRHFPRLLSPEFQNELSASISIIQTKACQMLTWSDVCFRKTQHSFLPSSFLTFYSHLEYAIEFKCVLKAFLTRLRVHRRQKRNVRQR